MSIEVKNLTKIYGTQKAIDEISFTASQGEILGLLGPNGAGKTTTMKILTGYMPASSGFASVCGYEAGKEDNEMKKRIGYLPEHNPLYGSMYVKEYLDFVGQVHKIKKRKARTAELIALVGLEREQTKKISSLSKGYKQRVGLAQALCHDPEVLILDEPISGLDPNQLIEIRNLISSLKKEKTIIFSSHILQEVESISDKIVILDKGKVVADDSLSSLSSGNQHSMSIEIEVLNEITMDILSALPEVQKVDKLSSKKYLITTAVNKDIREQVFDTIVANGNKLLGIQVDKKSLETVFKSVTNEKNN